MRDPYSVLGVKRDAAADEIKAAWRSKAKSVHPDHNLDDPTATGRFAEVGQAYDVLKDPARRRRYDTAAENHQTIMQQRQNAKAAEERAKAARANAEQVMEELARANAQRAQSQAKAKAEAQSQPQAQTQTQARSQKPQAEAPEDMVERIFGSGDEHKDAKAESHRTTQQARTETNSQQQQQQQAKAKAKAGPKTHDADAISDTDDDADADAEANSEAAAKTEPASGPSSLPLQAVDLIASLVRRIRGTATPPEKAPDLAAEAIVTIEDLIARENATVHLADDREVHFALEAGMTDGHMVRMKGQGLKMPPAARGDLIVTLRIARHERFRVEDFDLHTVLAISLEDAVLGTETEIETPGGKVPITVPAWSGSDRNITIEGLGLADGAGGRGALVVELRVILWEKPDEKVTDLMKHMRHGLYV